MDNRLVCICLAVITQSMNVIGRQMDRQTDKEIYDGMYTRLRNHKAAHGKSLLQHKRRELKCNVISVSGINK